MRRIGGAKPRIVAKKPVALSKSVDAYASKSKPPLSADRKLRSTSSTKSTKSTTDDTKPRRVSVARMGSSPRSGLMPKQTIKLRRSPSVDSESSMPSTPSTPLSPVQLQVPSTAFGIRRQANSAPVRKSISCVTDDLFDEDTIQRHLLQSC
uniref:Expressed conserved protein n=1 Tax=Panagrellus redivivus TaxID=6233 RepID=A0A7E4UPW3_PANRE